MSTSSTSSFFSSLTGAATLVVAADPDAAGAFLAASRIAFAWSNSNPVYADTATRFLNALRIECGAEAYVE